LSLERESRGQSPLAAAYDVTYAAGGISPEITGRIPHNRSDYS